MPLITLDEVRTYLGLETDETEFDERIAVLIPVVTNRLRRLCNRDFTVQPVAYKRRKSWYFGDPDLYTVPQVSATFTASSLTVVATGSNFASAMFASGQDVVIYGSYRNDGYYVVSSVSTSSMTVLSSYSFAGAATGTHEFKDEVTGATITFGIANWPADIKPIIASMIQYDYQERGTWSDAPGEEGASGEYGYPKELTRQLDPYKRPGYGEYLR